MPHRADIHIRDPFVVPLIGERRYCLYGTTGSECWGVGTGFYAYTGVDLENWDGPIPVFRPPAGFWATKNFWAPEVHPFNGRWYLFATFKSDDRERGTQVLMSDSPMGPFRTISDGPATPPAWGCLDGTLFVDDAGAPWMVFCHEWVQTRDGEMCAVRLTSDLSAAQGEPTLLFRASEAPWVRPIRSEQYGVEKGYVTDGPFLYRAGDGALLMLWSSVGATGYAIGVARSASGAITGPWTQSRDPLFGRNGGHGMLFRDFTGRLMLTIHVPNGAPKERPIFIEVEDAAEGLRCRREG